MEGTGLEASRDSSGEGLYGTMGDATGEEVPSLEDDKSLAPAGDWESFGTAEGIAAIDGSKGGVTLVELDPRTVRDLILEKKLGILGYYCSLAPKRHLL
jgi:hypothetical protein